MTTSLPAGLLVRIVAPHFVAGAIFTHHTGTCAQCASIVARWALGKTLMQVTAFAKQRGWLIEHVGKEARGQA